MNPAPLTRLSYIEPLEARIAPVADLVVQNVFFSFPDPDAVVPGDRGSVAFTVANVGDAATNVSGGKTGIHIYLSADATLDAADLLISRVQNQLLALDAGDTKNYKGKVTLPALKLPVPELAPGTYHVLVQVDSGFRVPEASEGNNATASAGTLDYVFQFGAVGTRTNVKLAVSDADGAAVFSLGPQGRGEFLPDATVPIAGNFLRLEVSDTTEKSTLLAAGSSRVDLGTIVVNGPLKLANLSAVNVARDATFGAVPKLILGDVGFAALAAPAVQQTLALNGPGATAVVLDRVADLHVNAPGGLSSLFATEWIEFTTGGAANDAVQAPFLSQFTIGGSKAKGLAGHSEVSLFLDGADAKGMTLGKVKIAGEIRDAVWEVRDTASAAGGQAGNILASGADGWNFTAQGGAGNVKILGDLIGGAGAPALSALYFGKIDISDELDGDIQATGKNSKGVAIQSLGADSAIGVEINAPMAGILGIKVEQWIGGAIATSWIRTLDVKGNKSGVAGDFIADLTLTGPELVVNSKGKLVLDAPAGVKGSLGTAKIAGIIGASTWSAFSDIGKIQAASIGAGFQLMGSDLGALQGTRVKEIKVAGDIGGTLHAAEFSRIEGKGEFTADVTATNPDPKARFVVIAGMATGVDLNIAHEIGLLSFSDWKDGTANAQFIDSIRITGIDAPGDLTNVNVTVSGRNPRGVSIGQLSAHGEISNVNVTTPDNGHIWTLHGQSWLGGIVQAGSVGSYSMNNPGGKVENFTMILHGANRGVSIESVSMRVAMNATFNIPGGAGSIIIHQLIGSTIDAGDGDIALFTSTTSPDALFEASHVTAGTILRLTVRNVNATITGTEYGFTADFIGTYERFVNTTKVQSLKALDAPGVADQAGDFRLLIA